MPTDDPAVFRDRLINVNPKRTAEVAMTILDRLQNSPDKAARIAGAALVFRALVRKYGVSPQLVMEVVNNLTSQQDRVRPEFRATYDFVNSEM